MLQYDALLERKPPSCCSSSKQLQQIRGYLSNNVQAVTTNLGLFKWFDSKDSVFSVLLCVVHPKPTGIAALLPLEILERMLRATKNCLTHCWNTTFHLFDETRQ